VKSHGHTGSAFLAGRTKGRAEYRATLAAQVPFQKIKMPSIDNKKAAGSAPGGRFK
jgi:hypothetical protein